MSDSELATVISAASALAAIAAAVAAFWSARVAGDAARQSSAQAHQTLLRDLSQSVTAITSRAGRIKGLVLRLKVARQTHCGLNGRNVTAAGPLIQDDEEKGAQAEQMRTAAHALEMRSFDQSTDEELQAFGRNMASHATRLEIMEADLVGELERVEAENREARTRNHRL